MPARIMDAALCKIIESKLKSVACRACGASGVGQWTHTFKITDAMIGEKNITSNKEHINKQEQDTLLEAKTNNNCNNTDIVKDCNVTLPLKSDCISGNTSLSGDCNTSNVANNNEHDIKTNEIPDNDSVLKYVYKKDEKDESHNKTKGHFKNSLKRRKRSSSIESNENLSSDQKDGIITHPDTDGNVDVDSSSSSIKNSPLIVDFETTHRPRGRITWSTSHENPNIVRGSDLADFNIETLHENLNRNQDYLPNTSRHATEAEHLNESNNRKEHYKENNDNKNYNVQTDEIDERSKYRERGEKDDPIKKEKEQYTNIKNNGNYNKESDDSNEHNRSRETGDSNYPINEEREQYKENKGSQTYNQEREESNEQDRFRARGDRDYPINTEKREQYKDNQNGRHYSKSDESNENDRYREKEGKDYQKNNERTEFYRDNNVNKKYNKEVDENDEHKERNDRNYSNNRESSREYNDHRLRANSKYLTPPEDSGESRESNENNKFYSSSAESKENIDRPSKEYYTEENSKLRDRKHDGHEIDNHRQHSNSYEPRTQQKLQESNIRNIPQLESLAKNNDEITTKLKPNTSFKNDYSNDQNNSSINYLQPNQKIDFDDFSYEKILNEKISGIPSTESYKGADPKSAVELLPSTTVRPDLEQQQYDTLEKTHKDNIAKNNNYSHEPANIHDEEVKPVVEISSESGSNEENSKELYKTNSGYDDLESIFRAKEIDKYDPIEKDAHRGDLKQQFERIPINYKHDNNKKQIKKKESINNENPKDESIDLPKHDGTLDVFAPNNVRYDENLNIKFDDVTVTLPEIKLPDDILAYARENSPYKDELDDNEEPIKQPLYHYNNEKKDYRQHKNSNNRYSSDHRQKNPDSNSSNKNDNGEVIDEPVQEYYKPYYDDTKKSQDYKKDEAEKESDNEEEEEEEEQEEEDLYEKFVRERFGKQGTFEKRSEQLRDASKSPLNPKLHQTIQSILNKTAEIEKQAETSGDPNAGYMWTLEYGENL